MFKNVQRRLFLLTALIPALVAPGTPAAISAYSAISSTIEVPIQLIGNHVMVPVHLQDRDLSFILDTGAGSSLIDMSVAKSLNIALGQPFMAQGAGPGGTPGAMLPLPPTASVGAGSDAVPVRVAAALDFSALSTHSGRDIDGILGGDFIRRFVVEIDYADGKLRLHDPAGFTAPPKATTVPLTFGAGTGFPHVRATLKLSETESFAVDCVLDVGSALQVIVTNPVVESRELTKKLSATDLLPIGRGAGGASDGRLARLPALSIGDLTVSKPVVILAGKNAGVLTTGGMFEGNIGTGLMRQFTVFFDYSRSRVTFEANALSGEPFEHDMSGLVLTTEGRPYKTRLIEMVVPGMAGAAAGLQPGDRLKSIDDANAETLSMDALRKLFQQDGRAYRLVVERDGKEVAVTLKLKRLV